MSAIGSKAIVAFSSLLLLHSCYSAHEYATLLSHSPSTSSSSSASSSSSVPPDSTTPSNLPATLTLPPDIIIETLIGVSLLCVGIVLGGWELKPISLRTWSGKLERKEVKDTPTTMYEFLESRGGFVDVRAQRKQFVDWVKENDLKSAMDE